VPLYRKLLIRALDKGMLFDLAAEMELMPMTLTRWASGQSKPHPRIMKVLRSSLGNLR
jgi:hypothetical protein